MCLACAVPVRGSTVGQECLAAALGDDAPPPEPPERARIDAGRWSVRLGFLCALIATALPWSRFGTGSEPFGAWGDTFRWSLVTAVLAVAGALAAVALRPSPGRWDVTAAVFAALVVAGAALAVADPPAFTSPWVGPWVAIGGAALALVAAVTRLVVGRRARRAHV